MFPARRTWILGLVALTALSHAACASKSSKATSQAYPSPAASPAPTVDVKNLAGAWTGFTKGEQGNTTPVEVQVSADGTYVSRVGSSSGTGTFKVVNGKIVTQGHLSGSAYGSDRQSTVSVKDKDGRMVLVGQGRSQAGVYSFELTKK
jgi:hypothetical protein